MPASPSSRFIPSVVFLRLLFPGVDFRRLARKQWDYREFFGAGVESNNAVLALEATECTSVSSLALEHFGTQPRLLFSNGFAVRIPRKRGHRPQE